MTAALVALTMYAEPYIGGPLFCGGTYTTTTPPWVAMPAEWYESGGQCGDTVGILADGKMRMFVALDRIAPGNWCVRQPTGECPPIAADVPQHLAWFRGSSTIGRVWNVTTIQETWDQFR